MSNSRLRHYFIPGNHVEEYATRIDPTVSDWREAVFVDLTEDGTKITYVKLPDTGEGPRIELCGDRYLGEACLDRASRDALFLFRIYDAKEKLPSSVPRHYEAEFILTRARFRPLGDLDRVEVAIPELRRPDDHHTAVDSLAAENVRAVLRPELSRILRGATADLRGHWRPLAAGGVSREEAPAALNRMKAVWSRYRLGQFARTTGRLHMILEGRIHLREGHQAEVPHLARLFSIELLNLSVDAHVDHQDYVYSLLEDWSTLPVEDDVRAKVWTGMSMGLDPSMLRRELHEIAQILGDRARENTFQEAWTPVLLELVETVADAHDDKPLGSLGEFSITEPSPLEAIANWAGKLRFSESPAAVEEVAKLPVPNLESTGKGNDPEFDRWVIGLRFPDVQDVENTGKQIHDWFAEVREHVWDALTIDGVSRIHTTLGDLRSRIDSWLLRLPDPRVLEKDHQEAFEAYKDSESLPPEVRSSLLGQGLNPNEFRDICMLLKQAHMLRTLPPWIWTGSPGDEPVTLTEDEDLNALAQRLVNGGVRRRVLYVVRHLGSYTDAMFRDLESMEPPGLGDDFETHIDQFAARIQRRKRILDAIPSEHAAWVQQSLEEGGDSEQLERIVACLEALHQKLSTGTFKDVLLELRSVTAKAGREQALTDYVDAATYFDRELGGASEASFVQLAAHVRRQNAIREATEAPTTSSGYDFDFTHNVVDEAGARVPLAFVQCEGEPYGFVTAPVLLTSTRREPMSATLDIEAHGPLAANWPRDWESPAPTQLRVESFAWRSGIEKRAHVFSFALKIPIRTPGEHDRLEVSLTARHPDTGAALTALRKLSWPKISASRERVSLNWPEGTNPEYVSRHPIGPQVRHSSIEERIKNGSSFAVIAPRRFGKSTLVEYLYSLRESEELIIPRPLVCTQYYSDETFNYRRLWEDCSQRLQDILGSSLAPVANRIPGPDAFDHVRRAAAVLGKRAIVVLFDEAQLFFAGPVGHRLGNQLKDALEGNWSSASSTDLVPLVFGFIGLPSTTERAGANICGLLRPIEHDAIDDDKLNRLLLHVTRSALHTTREARERLAAVSGDLYVLRTLLERIVERVNAEKRVWVNYDDVIGAESALKQSLRTGREQSLSYYIRDVMNEAESINQWHPRRCFPVALALANARGHGLTQAAQIEESALRLMNEWAESMFTTPTSRLLYTRELLDEHLRELMGLGVYQNGRFRSEFFEAWLAGVARYGFPNDQEAKDALFRGGVGRVITPQGLEPISRGAEAEVFRFTQEGEEFGFRRTRIDEKQRDRFLRAIRTFEAIQRGAYRKEPGSEFIFDLIEYGLSDEDELSAIQIYRWIRGTSLGALETQLGAASVAQIGFQLARALQLLHDYDILHRDIRPANVILEDLTARPVLVDFGMARLATDVSNTAIASEQAAPEVRGDAPRWSKAADLYGLGSTLRRLLDPSSKNASLLRPAIRRLTAVDPRERADAPAAATEFQKLVKSLHVDELRAAVWESTRAAAGEDWDKIWFRAVVEKFRARFESLGLGMHPQLFERASLTANFLNQVLEAFPARVGGRRYSLAAMIRAPEISLPAGLHNEIELLNALRNRDAHGSAQAKKNLLHRYGCRSDDELRAMVRRGAASIAEILETPSVGKLVEMAVAAERVIDAVGPATD